jgi:hypothetical protein
MKLLHRTPRPAAPPAAEPAPSKLAGVRPVAHDDDERASAQDRGYGETIFTRPAVPLPRVLTGRKRRKRD